MTHKTQQSFMTRSAVVVLGALFCCLLWGSAFPFIKIGYSTLDIHSSDAFSQILFAGVRFTSAGILTLILGSIRERKVLLPQKTSWKYILVLSLFQTILQYVFFYMGLAHTSGVKSSIIEGVNVFVAILVAALLFRQEKINARKMLGCLIGFIGLVLVNLVGNSDFHPTFTLSGEGAILLSTVAYAFSSVFMKQFSKKEDPVMLSGSQFILGGLVMVIIGLINGGSLNPAGNPLSIKAVVVLFWLAFVSAGAYSVWSVLLKYNTVSRITVFGFMTPVFGVLLSALLLRETSQLAPISLLALLLVSLGIYICQKA